jgi:hypothetical protein
MEKVQFRDIFTDYMELIDDYGSLQEKLKQMDTDFYYLR